MAAPSRFINRELSWLEFDRRVLALTTDPRRPLLERLKFLAIFSQNLDEFFQVRVADLQDRAEGDPHWLSPDGRTAEEQLSEIREQVIELTAEAQQIFASQLRPALAREGIEIVSGSSLSPREREIARQVFESEIRPVLIPLAVDSAHPFPYVSALSISIGAMVGHPQSGRERFARVKVPPFVPRFFQMEVGRFVPVEDIILAHLESFFPEDPVQEAGCFRVTRDADLDLRERDGVDLASEIEVGLRRQRRGSDAVRLEISGDLGPRSRGLLREALALADEEVYDSPGPLDLGALWELYGLDRPDLKDAPWTPRPVQALVKSRPAALFDELRARDHLVHHPYESFESSVEGLLKAAAEDPDVRVIMCTIYRTGGPETGIVQALEGAAARGKQVVVLIELKARFEEAANLERARSLERAGAHVVYGVMGLKTHAKLALVIRAERDGLRRYCHVGTGNYNPVTARLYEDIGLLTASPDVTRDVANVFERLTSASAGRDYGRLLVAPELLRDGVIERIERQARPGGRIVFKLNSLADPAIIEALYAAAGRGAQIDLVVRGICCLRPGVQGLSERIRVRSILGRFLEHSRILRFGHPTEGAEYWLGSADLMARNLDLRVEALVPIVDPALCSRLDRLLAVHLQPETRAWELGPDGHWKPTGGTVDAQELLLDAARGA